MSKLKRPLKEKGCSTFIRFNEAIPILRKVQNLREESFASLVSPQTPFGIISSFKNYETQPFEGCIKIYFAKGYGYTDVKYISKNEKLANAYKVFITKSYGAGEGFPHQILNKPFLGELHSCCTQTYLVIGPFQNEKESSNVLQYIKTKFFRFMVMLKKIRKMQCEEFMNLYQFKILQKNGLMKNFMPNMV